MMLLVVLALSANVASAAIPGWDSLKLKDFCNGTCPSTPDSSGLPHYGQALFPAMTADSNGRLYIISAKFGGAYLDAPKLTCFSPTGETQWTLTSKLAPGPQSAYWLEILDDALFVFSVGGFTAQGATKGHIVKVSLNGTALWYRDVVGSPTMARDGTIYTLSTPDTGKGSYVSAVSPSGKELWTYNDGVSRYSYLEIGGAKSQWNLCMPAQVGSKGFVHCLDNQGKLAHTELVANSTLVRYDLIAQGGHYYVRKDRDNSYYHKGKNELYQVGGGDLKSIFPDDVNFVGPISSTSFDPKASPNTGLVVMSRPDCPNDTGMGCRPDSLVAVGYEPRAGAGVWMYNVTLPGAGDVVVNPAFPPSFGPYGGPNGMVYVSTVKKLHADNKTYDMWYSAIDKEGHLAWKLPIANIQDLTRVTYGINWAGDFHVIFDGVLYKVPAKKSSPPKNVYV